MNVTLYEVGGSIRDELIARYAQRPVFKNGQDLDYSAECSEGWGGLNAWAKDHMDKIFLVTPEFFTIRGIKDGEVMDVVMARKEGSYSDGRHPDSCEPGTIQDDLARRDFTMNAIARNVETRELIDPYEGDIDISLKLIRCVGNAEDRLREDSLRILRALRFSITKNFHVHHDITYLTRYDLFENNDGTVSSLLANVSRERVREELVKMFKYDTHKSMEVLNNVEIVAPSLKETIFGDDIWLKPTVESR